MNDIETLPVLDAEAVAYHELGHALAGIDQGLVVYGIEFERCGQGWGGRALCQEDVPDELIPAYLVFLTAGTEASLIHCEQTGAPVQDFAHQDRVYHAGVVQYAAERGVSDLPSWEEAALEAREVVLRLWPRITALAPVLAEQKVMIRSELMG